MSWPARSPATTSPPARPPSRVRRPMRSRPRRASRCPVRPTARPRSVATTRPSPISTRRWRSRPNRRSARRSSTGRRMRPASRRVIRRRTRRARSTRIGSSAIRSPRSPPPGGSERCSSTAGEINRALEVLEAASAESETVGDEPTRAGILANLARVHMRLGHAVESIAAADEALAIAERLDLEPVVAEALVNKGSALSQLGRRREAIALDEAALRMAQALPTAELRDAGPQQPGLAFSETTSRCARRRSCSTVRSVAREMGDRGMYYWLTSQASWGVRAEARDWDEQMSSACAGRSTRPPFVATAFDSGPSSPGSKPTRGEDLGTLEQELEDMLGDSTDPDQQLLRAARPVAYGRARRRRCRDRLPEGGESPGPPDAGRGRRSAASRSARPSGPVTTSASALQRPS